MTEIARATRCARLTPGLTCLAVSLVSLQAWAGDCGSDADGLGGKNRPVDPLANLSLFEDVTGRAGIQEVGESAAWQRVLRPRFSLNFGYTRSAHWLRIPIGPRFATATELILVENAFVDSMTLYWPQDDGRYQISQTGATIPVAKRVLPHRYPAIPLGPAPRECSFAYVRLATSDVAAYPIRILSYDEFRRADHDEQLVSGTYYGVLAAMLIFNIFVFLYLREATYFEYSAFIASFVAFEATCNGLASEYLWPHHGEWNHIALSVTCGLASFFGLGFATKFMAVRDLSPRLFWGARVSRSLSLALLPAGLLSSRIAGVLGSIVAFTAAFLALAIGIAGLARRHRPTPQYLIAGAAFGIGVLLNALRNFGLLGDNLITAHGNQIGSVALVMLLTLALLARFNVLHQEKQRAQAESLSNREDALRSLRLTMQFKLQALQAKINPHFLFNALNTIDALIVEDPVRASNIVCQLSQLFRYTLAVTERERVPLSEEMEIVRSYLEIEHARFGKRLQYTVETSGDLDASMIPGLTLQPLVENSIRHGLSPKAEGGTVMVRADVRDGECHLVVADDGVGLKFSDANGRGHGLANVRERLRLAYADMFSMAISTDRGTRVEIHLPLQGAT